MNEIEKGGEDALVVAVLERMRTQRLPRALDIKAKVDSGGTLDEFDIEFLGQVFADAGECKKVFDRHPELREIGAQLSHIYHHITERALANETGAGRA
jgi:hypothetical protein